MSKDETAALTATVVEADSQSVTVKPSQPATLTPANIREQVNLIQAVMGEVMKSGEHFGTIPGCGDKPTLLKPGAEKLALTFRLCPEYRINKSELENDHREYEVVCILSHIPTGQVLGQGVGACSTKESKYRYRNAGLTCPACGKMDTIIKGKAEYGGGWVCFDRKGGCRAKFADGDDAIEKQPRGKVEHDNPADYYNTVLKMAKKRAQVDATLTATGASDIFTQDIEDLPDEVRGSAPAPAPNPPVSDQAPPSNGRPKVADVNYGSGGICPPSQRNPENDKPPTVMSSDQGSDIDKMIETVSNSPEHKTQVIAWVEGIAGAAINNLNAEQADRVIAALSAQLGQ